ncbi:GroEL-like apical domain-containing protein [Obelidium mucronatum]|nr:GroEL-like apical domain-containing protein [Obelidium mucronatum]
MLETIENPRILTIAFPLEYQRSSQHFQYVSLETVLAQEKDYLHLLMGRIISLRPAVVLVGGNVSRIALDLFVRARVSLCTNVKPEILEAVARCSGSTIVKSFDQLIESSVGLFGRYSVRVFDDPLIEGTRKSFVYLEGCPKERIGTIILRGATFSDLVTIKSVMSIVAFASYNIHVERAFLQDELAFLMVEESEDLKPVASAPCDDGTSRLQLALKKYESTCLSVSPYVTYPVPYILAKLNQLKNIPLDTVSMASSTAVQDQLISSLESNSAPYYEKLDSLSPFNYQKIVFLFSSICIDTMIPCQPAELHVIEYYSETDISVGAYIKELCTNNHSTCPTKGCGLPMIRHFRSYAHGEGSLECHCGAAGYFNSRWNPNVDLLQKLQVTHTDYSPLTNFMQLLVWEISGTYILYGQNWECGVAGMQSRYPSRAYSLFRL